MGGLGLDSFLTHGENTKRKFLNWKDDGEIVVWLSTRADIAYASWSHAFPEMGTFENKEGEEIEVLRWPRFVSPDPEIVHASQFFRDENNDRMKVPPVKDPFLRLREWLRFECEDMPLGQTIFKWAAPQKDGGTKIIEWKRGELARLVNRGQSNYGHSLDTKLDYLFVVCSDKDPSDGCQIVRNTKLLGDKMKKAIQEQMESNGEKGNPLLHPYAFKWVFDKNAAMNDMYRAFRYNKAVLTEKIREAIESKEFPDPSQDCVPRPGDKARIRAAMEDAAEVDLPWDRLFVDEWQDEDESTNFPPADKKEKTTTEVNSKPAEKKGKAGKPKNSGKPATRRKKKAEPKPEPQEEMIPCDDCNTPMKASATKCPNCGAEYEVEASEASGSSEASAAPAQEDRPKDKDGKPIEKCWSCGATEFTGNCCDNCGIEVDDDIPF